MQKNTFPSDVKAARAHVTHFFKRNPSMYRGFYEHFEDMVQCCMLAEWRAKQSFDPSRGASFETWRTWQYRGAIKIYLDRISARHYALRDLHALRQYQLRLTHVSPWSSNDPTDPDINSLESAKRVYGSADDAETKIINSLEHEDADQINYVLEALRKVLLAKKAPQAEQDIVHAVFVARLQGKTLQEIGAGMDRSRERVRQIIAKYMKSVTREAQRIAKEAEL